MYKFPEAQQYFPRVAFSGLRVKKLICWLGLHACHGLLSSLLLSFQLPSFVHILHTYYLGLQSYNWLGERRKRRRRRKLHQIHSRGEEEEEGRKTGKSRSLKKGKKTNGNENWIQRVRELKKVSLLREPINRLTTYSQLVKVISLACF